MKKITVVIPCHNEEHGIGRVVSGIPTAKLKQYGFIVEVLIINNCSTDRTAEVAREAGAIVIDEPKKGKGNAMRTGFQAVSQDTKYVVMIDGDDSYKGREILRMIEPLDSGFCNVVVGSRLGGKLKQGSLTSKHRLANWFYTFLVRYLYQANITDVLSGFFAWKKASLDELIPYLESDGFAIEMEMITRMKKLGFDLYSVPITYDERVGESKISSVRDGIKILHMLFKNLLWIPESENQKQTPKIFGLLKKIRNYLPSGNDE